MPLLFLDNIHRQIFTPLNQDAEALSHSTPLEAIPLEFFQDRSRDEFYEVPLVAEQTPSDLGPRIAGGSEGACYPASLVSIIPPSQNWHATRRAKYDSISADDHRRHMDLPGASMGGRSVTGCEHPSPQHCIRRPAGPLSKPNGGGYSLKTSLGWDQDTYLTVQRGIRGLCKRHLDLRHRYDAQSPQLKVKFREAAIDMFPQLRYYVGAWPAEDFAAIYLKNTVNNFSTWSKNFPHLTTDVQSVPLYHVVGP